MYVGIVRTLNHVGETYMVKLKRAYVAVGTYKNKIRKRKKETSSSGWRYSRTVA
jgi:hypothetical protein